MANTIQFRRGLEADRTSVTPAAGEILYTTDDKKVYIGDGSTAGGNIVSAAGGAAIEATASGALANGDLVIVNSDGTVSVVAETINTTPVVGTPSAYTTANTTYKVGIAYDTNAQKFVVFYTNTSSSNYLYAVVGTVSGTSISFGTPVVADSTYTMDEIHATYDANAQKVVVVYRYDSYWGYGGAKVGTISGTSISFGSRTMFSSTTVQAFNITYDSVSQQVVAAYEESSQAKGRVGTVSGTSISFGTAGNIGSGGASNICMTYDTANERVVVAYRASSSVYSAVGTVSGTGISFGTPVVVESQNESPAIAYDADAGKIVVAYEYLSASLRAKVGTVSGTSISFGSRQTLVSSRAFYLNGGYDSDAGKVVIAYQTSSSTRDAVILTVSGTSITAGTPVTVSAAYTVSGGWNDITYDPTEKVMLLPFYASDNYVTALRTQTATPNLTATNFIGISDGAYADTATATIQTAGAVDDAQTGLTAGSTYYVQTDGTLSTTTGSPSVVAGTAVSSTSILVKG